MAKKMTKQYHVKFNVPEYNSVYTFERDKSPCAPYGNQTSVVIFKNEQFVGIIDTRYDHSVMEDFGAWCVDWLSSNFDPSFEPKWREI